MAENNAVAVASKAVPALAEAGMKAVERMYQYDKVAVGRSIWAKILPLVGTLGAGAGMQAAIRQALGNKTSADIPSDAEAANLVEIVRSVPSLDADKAEQLAQKVDGVLGTNYLSLELREANARIARTGDGKDTPEYKKMAEHWKTARMYVDEYRTLLAHLGMSGQRFALLRKFMLMDEDLFTAIAGMTDE